LLVQVHQDSTRFPKPGGLRGEECRVRGEECAGRVAGCVMSVEGSWVRGTGFGVQCMGFKGLRFGGGESNDEEEGRGVVALRETTKVLGGSTG